MSNGKQGSTLTRHMYKSCTLDSLVLHNVSSCIYYFKLQVTQYRISQTVVLSECFNNHHRHFNSCALPSPQSQLCLPPQRVTAKCFQILLVAHMGHGLSLTGCQDPICGRTWAWNCIRLWISRNHVWKGRPITGWWGVRLVINLTKTTKLCNRQPAHWTTVYSHTLLPADVTESNVYITLHNAIHVKTYHKIHAVTTNFATNRARTLITNAQSVFPQQETKYLL